MEKLSYREKLQALDSAVRSLYFEKGLDYDLYMGLRKALSVYSEVSKLVDTYTVVPFLFFILGKSEKMKRARILLDNMLKVFTYNVNILYSM